MIDSPHTEVEGTSPWWTRGLLLTAPAQEQTGYQGANQIILKERGTTRTTVLLRFC